MSLWLCGQRGSPRLALKRGKRKRQREKGRWGRHSQSPLMRQLVPRGESLPLTDMPLLALLLPFCHRLMPLLALPLPFCHRLIHLLEVLQQVSLTDALKTWTTLHSKWP